MESVNLYSDRATESLKAIRPDLTEGECTTVLEYVKKCYGMSGNVSPDTIDTAVSSLFGELGKSEQIGAALYNSLTEHLGSLEGAQLEPGVLSFTYKVRWAPEIVIEIEVLQTLDKSRLYHHWYGGDLLKIKIASGSAERTGTISANGDIRARLSEKDGTELAFIKDSGNNGAFYGLSQYIASDRELSRLLFGAVVDGPSLTIDNVNWWELTVDGDNDASLVLDPSFLLEALEEAVIEMYSQL